MNRPAPNHENTSAPSKTLSSQEPIRTNAREIGSIITVFLSLAITGISLWFQVKGNDELKDELKNLEKEVSDLSDLVHEHQGRLQNWKP